jgi:small redox-active disulfide protein 2
VKNKITKIEVLGSGCPSCKKLFELTKQAVQAMNIKTEVEYITDIQKIIEMGVMQTPVLAINGKPVMTGATSDLEKIMGLLR